MKKTAPNSGRRICHPGEVSDNVTIDPEFETLVPPLSARELTDLQQSLDAEGCRDALVIWQGHDTLVDGHNRIKHCRAKGYPFPVVEKEFADRDEVKTFIITTQLGRRNLSPAAESYLRGKRYLEAKRQGTRTDLTSGHSDQKSAAERLGDELKVGERTIRRDGKFAEAVDGIVENCGIDARNIILARETGLTRGGVIRLSKLEPGEQKTFVRQLKEGGKRPRKPRKEKTREKTITIPAQPKRLVSALLEQLKPEEIAEVSLALAAAVQSQGSKQHQETRKGTKSRSRKSTK